MRAEEATVLNSGREKLPAKEPSIQRGDEKTRLFSRHWFHEPCPRVFKNCAERLQLPFMLFAKTFLEAQQECSFQGRMKAGFLHLGTTFREGQSVTVSQWAADSTTLFGWLHPLPQLPHAAKNLPGSKMTPLFALLMTTAGEGRWPWDSYQSSSCNRNSWQGDWERGNVGLDLIPVIVLIHSWLLLNQFLAVFHRADIAFLLLPSKRGWKKCLLLLFFLVCAKTISQTKLAEPWQWHELASSKDHAARSKWLCKQKSRRL